MTTLTELSTAFLAEKTVVVHLRANKSGNPVEIDGAGYKPVKLTGQQILDGDEASFTFTGPLGWVYGWYATIDGEQIEAEGEIFPQPFFVGGKGFRIRIPMSATAQG